MREAKEGEIYMQHSFSHWVLMWLHTSLRKDIYKRIGGISAMGRASGLTKENASTTILSPNYEGREIQHTSG